MSNSLPVPEVSEGMQELIANACEEAADYASSPAVSRPSAYPARDALDIAIAALEADAKRMDFLARQDRLEFKPRRNATIILWNLGDELRPALDAFLSVEELRAPTPPEESQQ